MNQNPHTHEYGLGNDCSILTKVQFWPPNLGGIFILALNFKTFYFDPISLFSYQMDPSVHLS